MTHNCVKEIQERQSIRRFSKEPIPEKIIEEILTTGFSAPSAGNRQPWRVVKVTTQELKDKLALAAGGQTFLARAPVVFVVCAVPQESADRYGERGFTLYALQDTAALVENILLAVHFLGYASCWIGAFNESEVENVLNVPTGIRPVAILPVGMMEGKRPPKPARRAIKDVIIKELF
ncbi:MAG: nitroreductase family protein [Candidatus Odinarchaeota archaeon]